MPNMMPESLFYTWVIVAGLCLGSFINVVALRDDDRMSLLKGRSCCPKCHHTLQWYELIPLLSYLLQGGRCRNCGRPIAWRYPMVEIIAAFLTLFSVHYGVVARGSWWLTVGLLVSLLLFLVVSLIDLDTQTVPLDYVLAAGLIGGMTLFLTDQMKPTELLLGATTGAGVLAFITYGWLFLRKEAGMGEGDIWIAGSLGLLLGWKSLLVALFSAVLLGAVIGSLVLVVSKWQKNKPVEGKKILKTAIPFGPFLAVGLLISLQWGPQIMNWYIYGY